ncbi:MAG: ABC transporter permease [Deinococcus sp.]|nr:ABC transporter permease [Deinococcus sp.]
MLRILVWEFGKLIRLRSVQVGLLASLLLPVLWVIAPGLRNQFHLNLISAWQVPALSLRTGMDFLFPFLVAMAAAEVLGSEVSLGTLKSVLLRPSPRSRLLLAKLLVALLYPFLLLATSLAGSLLVGIPYGLGNFYGGTGLNQPDAIQAFVGMGLMTSQAALLEVVKAHLLAGLVLAPIAALSLLYGTIFLATTTAALAAISSLLLMRLLVAFPSVQPFLLTTYLGLYVEPSSLFMGLSLLFIYTAGFSGLAMLVFDRKDV